MRARILRMAVAGTLLLCVGLWFYTWMQVRGATATYGPQGEFALVDGQRVHYVSAGEGPAVALLHGNPGSVRDFDRLIPDLSADHRVVAVDRPGHGYSERRGDATPRRQAALLRAALAQLGISRPLLVGHSWGGGLALVYALEYPDEVAGLVLAGPRTQVQHGEDDWLYRMVRTPFVGGAMEWTILLPMGRRLVGQGLAAAYAPDPLPPEELAAAKALWLRPRQVDATVWDTANLQEALAAYAPRYRELLMPISIVTGEHDDLLPESMALDASAPGTSLTEIAGAGHMVIKTRPRAVADAVRAMRGPIDF
jgi:pimeloyl-ACP methyl ester carboxylesterase